MGRPSVYFVGSVSGTDRLFNDKALGHDEEGEARQVGIREQSRNEILKKSSSDRDRVSMVTILSMSDAQSS